MSTDVVPRIDVTIGVKETLNEDVLKFLAQLRPKWSQEDIVLKLSPLSISTGVMNTMVKCFLKQSPDEAVMVRVHNEKLSGMVDRTIESDCIKHLHDHGCAPNIYATFNNGFCYEFIHGETLTFDRLSQEPIWRLIAQELGKIHAGDIVREESLNPNINPKGQTLKFGEMYPEEIKDERYRSLLPTKEEMNKDLLMMIDHVSSLGSPMVLCHMDTRGENIIWNPKTGVLKFVDYEVMNYNTQALELASHFSRFGGFDPVDCSLYPSKEFQLKWMKVYLKQWHQSCGRGDEPILDIDLEKLYVQVTKYYLFYLLIMATFGAINITTNFVEKSMFDMVGYSVTVYKEFKKLKSSILAMELPQ